MRLRRIAMACLLVPALVLGACSKTDEKAFDKVDYNKDGKIIFEELIIAFPDLTVDEFLAADGNHDGALDQKEYQRFLEARKSGKKLEPAPEAAAQPAAPAAQPAPPTAPAPAVQSAPATPASQPAAATPQPAATAPAAPVEPAAPAPETPAPQPAAPEAAKPAGEAAGAAYVVQRGDSLSRIAAKFGVGAKEIMEANGMQNADKLTGGATIIIPGPAAAARAASPAVTAFVKDFFAKSAAGDVNALLDLYGDKVDYNAKGKIGRDVVRQDKVSSFTLWPKRTYTPGPASVSEPDAAGDIRVSVPVAYTLANGAKTASGNAVFTFVLRPAGDAYRIVGEGSVVQKRK